MKNLKLLLASTAILSTTLAIRTVAGYDPVISTLDARINITSPFTLTRGSISFGSITNRGSNVVVSVNPDGTLENISNGAQMLASPSITPMYLSGGFLSNWSATGLAQDATATQGRISDLNAHVGHETNSTEDEEALAQAIAANTAKVSAINGLLNSYATSTDMSIGYGLSLNYENGFALTDSHGTACGTATLYPYWKWSDANGMEISFGGQFRLADTYNPTDGADLCTYQTEVTLVYNPSLYQ